MTQPKLLLCYPSPRDIPSVLAESDILGKSYDRLFAKYMPQKEAYAALQSYFLQYTEYTHLVICPDDLLVKSENVARLETHLKAWDYQVLSGVCNIDMKDLDTLAVARNVPALRTQEGQRHYDFFKNRKWYQGIHHVGFSGFCLMAIRRDVVEKIALEGDGKYNDGAIDQAFDVVFANRCEELDIPIFADFSNFMIHYRHGGEIMVGKKPPELRFIQKGVKGPS